MTFKQIINNKRIRAYTAQIALLLTLILGTLYLASNAIINLERQGIASGFDFLWFRAGFDIYSQFLEYSADSPYYQAYFVGLLNTVLVAVFGIILATIIGFIVGVARLSDNWLVEKTAYWFVEITRNIPVLVWIVIWYYGVFLQLPTVRQSINISDSIFLNNRGLYLPKPEFGDNFVFVAATLIIGIIGFIIYRMYANKTQVKTGKQLPFWRIFIGTVFIAPLFVFFLVGTPMSFEYPALKGFNFKGGMVLIPEFTALLVALSLYTAASIAELVRGGIISVSKGQTEAALSLNLTPKQTMNKIIIPQALRVIIPPLNSQYLNLTKNSSLAVAVGYMDVANTMGGTILNQTGQALECMFFVLMTYLALSLIISTIMNRVNKSVQIVER